MTQRGGATATPAGVNHVVLNVRDIEESHRFWTEIVGLKQVGALRPRADMGPTPRMRFYSGERGGKMTHHDVALVERGITPSIDLMWACWFTLTGVHAVHVLGGAVYTGWLAGPSHKMAEFERERWSARIEATRRYWLFVDAVWLFIVAGFYLV